MGALAPGEHEPQQRRRDDGRRQHHDDRRAEHGLADDAVRQAVARHDQAHLAARDHPDSDAHRLPVVEAERARASRAAERLGDDRQDHEQHGEDGLLAEVAPVRAQADAHEEHGHEHRVGERREPQVDLLLERRLREQHAGHVRAR